MTAFKTFLHHLRSKFTTGKGGDTAFKQLPDGSFINAYNTIADSFKFVEEAIMVSNVNGGRPTTEHGKSTGRAGTALSGNSKSNRGPAAAAGDTTADASLAENAPPPKNVFSIGINCDANNLFNKDPKDPNKYEIEGVKTQSSMQQLIEYYIKLCQDHPLISYIEDPFADSDMEGFRKFKEAMAHAGLGYVKIGMRSIFRDSNLVKVRDVTSIRPLTAEE